MSPEGRARKAKIRDVYALQARFIPAWGDSPRNEDKPRIEG
jgi:hypothetical protein